jgi:hypothetical protein
LYVDRTHLIEGGAAPAPDHAKHRGPWALGLEWALVARGASTVLASHWNISFTTAVVFFERFYRGWLADGLSRAQDAPASSRVISATVKNNSTEMKAAREGLQLAA